MKFMLALAFLFLALPAQAALPASEEAYMKGEEARFEAADTNRDGQLQRNEIEAAFMGGDLQLSAATHDLCARAGRGLIAQYAPPPGSPAAANFQPMSKRDFLVVQQGRFNRADTNQDHVVTAEELSALDRGANARCASGR